MLDATFHNAIYWNCIQQKIANVILHRGFIDLFEQYWKPLHTHIYTT